MVSNTAILVLFIMWLISAQYISMTLIKVIMQVKCFIYNTCFVIQHLSCKKQFYQIVWLIFKNTPTCGLKWTDLLSFTMATWKRYFIAGRALSLTWSSYSRITVSHSHILQILPKTYIEYSTYTKIMSMLIKVLREIFLQ